MITVIAAVSQDGFIGKNGRVPWRLKSDMDHFKKVTTGYPVVMGRKTWESLPPRFRPLPDRRNIVVTRQVGFSANGADVVHSLEDALALTAENEHVFVIGGGEVYRQALPLAERLLMTRVAMTIGDGDVRFPAIEPGTWNLVSRTEGVRGENDECDFTIEDYSPNLRYIELANVRTIKQLQEYRLIRQCGHCPFCPENLKTYHDNPIIHDGTYWVLTQNDYPYAGTDAHLLLILKAHRETVGSLTAPEQQEYFSIIGNLETEGKFPGGGICARSGNPLRSGASVKHLHFHVIAPTEGAEPVTFFMGKGKR